ncbi:MAG: TolC family outer membrane protein [Stagnimonas sp.]|nr:TolC family outer membrane protein [Stagnimonas sp.]
MAVIGLSIFVLPMSAVRANDLLTTYAQALRHDAVLRASRYQRDAALEAKPAARAMLLPRITASYDRVYNDSEIEVGYVDPTTGTPITLSRQNDGTDKSLNLSLTQPLFSLEAWYQLKQADEQVALAQLGYQASEQALMLRVAETYFGALAASDRQRTVKAEKDALWRQLDLAKQNMAIGLASVTDTGEVQARYDLAVAEELATSQDLGAAREALEEITRPPLATIDEKRVRVVPLPGPVVAPKALAGLRDNAAPAVMSKRLDQWLDEAQLGNFDLLAAKLDFDIAARDVKAANANHLPTLAATVTYTDARTGGGAFPTKAEGTAVGVGVKLPLFSGGATQSGVRRAVAAREQKLAEFDGSQRQVERQVRVAYQAVLSGTARVKALKLALASSGSALVAVETGQEIGTRTAIDLLNVQQQRYGAERNYNQARYDQLLALLRLKALTGRLAIRDLAEVDALLAAPT